MTRDVLTNAQLLQAIAGVDGLDDRQIAGTPFRENVPNYVALLSAARSAHALLSVGQEVTNFAPGETRKMRVGILKEAESVSLEGQDSAKFTVYDGVVFAVSNGEDHHENMFVHRVYGLVASRARRCKINDVFARFNRRV